MKLKDFKDLIVFDEFPNRYNSQQRIVLTHLLHLEKETLPERLCPIITTKYMSEKFKEYCRQKGAGCLSTLNFILLEPFRCHDIVLAGRHSLEFLICESQEATRNCMVLIREDGKLKCIYAGNFLDIRNALFNDEFASWIEKDTVPEMYLNLNRCQESPEKQDIDIMIKVFEIIQQLIICFPDYIFHMYVPQFGYDNFIVKLAKRYPNRISIANDLQPYLNRETEKETLTFTEENLHKTKILILPGKPSSLRNVKCPYSKREMVTIHLQEEFKKFEDIEVLAERNLYKLYYTPEPSAFHLQLFCLLLKPKRLHGIIGRFNTIYKVPSYLVDLCGPKASGNRQSSGSSLGKSLRSLAAVKETGKVLTYGPNTKNLNQGKNVYVDTSDESSD